MIRRILLVIKRDKFLHYGRLGDRVQEAMTVLRLVQLEQAKSETRRKVDWIIPHQKRLFYFGMFYLNTPFILSELIK